MEVGEYNGNLILFDEFMKGKEDMWDQVVKKYNLEFVKFNDIGYWWFVDLILNQFVENVSSMNKSKEFGFLGWCDMEKSFLLVLDKMKVNNLIF